MCIKTVREGVCERVGERKREEGRPGENHKEISNREYLFEIIFLARRNLPNMMILKDVVLQHKARSTLDSTPWFVALIFSCKGEASARRKRG